MKKIIINILIVAVFSVSLWWVLIGPDRSDDRYHRDVNSLVAGEDATFYASKRGPEVEGSALGVLKIDEQLIKCLKGFRHNVNVDGYDRILVLKTHQSNVYLRITFFEKRIQFVHSLFKKKGSDILQYTGNIYQPRCYAFSKEVVDKIYGLPRNWYHGRSKELND